MPFPGFLAAEQICIYPEKVAIEVDEQPITQCSSAPCGGYVVWS
jgi:hypothetical protein